jgi:hydrogenase nickel incorporation protein HypA/HybF
MHELAVTENVLKIALKHTPEGRRVREINIVVGQLSSIVNDSVQFYWDMVSEATPAAGAKLHFQRIPAELQCQDCQTRYPPAKDELACPNCHGLRAKIVTGEEFYIESIEVE